MGRGSVTGPDAGPHGQGITGCGLDSDVERYVLQLKADTPDGCKLVVNVLHLPGCPLLDTGTPPCVCPVSAVAHRYVPRGLSPDPKGGRA